MFDAPTRVLSLTRSQRKVLADLLLFRDSRNIAVISSRKLAQTTGLPRTTVCSAIERLNELQLIRSYGGSRTAANRHVVSLRVPVLEERGRTQPGKAGRS